MDPKGGQKPLNPNLQAAYDRIMGLDASGNAVSGTPQAPATPTTITNPPTPTPLPSQPTTPTPAMPTMPQPATPAEPISAATPQPTVSINQPVNPTEPAMPTLPTTPITPPTPINQPAASPAPDMPAMPAATEDTTMPPANNPPMEAMNAAMNLPQVIPHDTETVKIGLGGSPMGSAAKPKGKGLSPTILIVGAFVFLIVYALFWVRFFNLPLPFLGK